MVKHSYIFRLFVVDVFREYQYIGHKIHVIKIALYSAGHIY